MLEPKKTKAITAAQKRPKTTVLATLKKRITPTPAG